MNSSNSTPEASSRNNFNSYFTVSMMRRPLLVAA
jgi:hypothetical protein